MARHGYSFGARLLHRVALGHPAIAEAALDLDLSLFGGDEDDAVARPVFVTGLARAGTTILMRRLHDTGAFRSLTYRDMPFVLAPNLWQRIAGSRPARHSGQRAHGDGIVVDTDSPEAFEDVFWRVVCGDLYLRDDRLVPMTADAEARDRFRRYVAAILQPCPGKRYLSKNNNNLLRLGTLVEAFPDGTIIIPFRAPRPHAASLRRQHVRFCSAGRDDRFTRDYMRWLGHHEFGPGHRPLVFDGKLPEGIPESDLDYWLRVWIDTYRHALANASSQAVFVSYERLCEPDGDVWQALCDRLDLAAGNEVEPLRMAPQASDTRDTELTRKADAIHKALLARAL